MNRSKLILSLLAGLVLSGCSINDETVKPEETLKPAVISNKTVITQAIWPLPKPIPKAKLVFKEFEIAKPNKEGEYTQLKSAVFSSTASVIFDPLQEQTTKRDSRYDRVLSAIDNHSKEQPSNWNDLVESVKVEQNPIEKLKLANSIINKVPYKDGTDGTYYHPAKLFKKGGVCKDMAISKYLLLKDAGFNVDDMRLAVLTPRIDSPDSPLHVVLVAKDSNQEYVLDLLPKNLAEQELKSLKTTKKAQIMKIKEAGIDINDVDVTTNGFYELSKYKSERGLIWAGNETGTKESFYPPRVKKSKINRY